MLTDCIQVIERGWLSSNNVLIADGRSAALVDSGYGSHAPQTLALVERALAGRTLALLANTHCHSDHIGGNAALLRAHHCELALPAGEAPLLEAWDERALMLGFAGQSAERFAWDRTFTAGDTLRLGPMDWQVLAAPGHDTHALMFWSPEEHILISGDALWENGFGVVFGQIFGRDTALAETRATLDAIAALRPRAVIPGHGAAFDGVDAALARAYTRVESFEADILRLVRHALKVMLVFTLLDRRSIALAALPGYLDGVEVYGDLNRRYLGLTTDALAQWLVSDLEKSRALRVEDGMLRPTIAA
jgi:glyoxylase-like metal-dependent hydrolase (beta-lactamase superfamily II)